jgi:hypothetical protein
VADSALASKTVKTAIERQSKEVSLARTNNFLDIYGGLVSMCHGMCGKRHERMAGLYLLPHLLSLRARPLVPR